MNPIGDKYDTIKVLGKYHYIIQVDKLILCMDTINGIEAHKIQHIPKLRTIFNTYHEIKIELGEYCI